MDFGDKLGEEIPTKFADGLGQAFKDAMSGAKDLDDALSDAGRSFLGYMRDAFLQQAADQAASSARGIFGTVLSTVLGSFGGGTTPTPTPVQPNISTLNAPRILASRGGLIKGFSKGGAVGSDIIPAMLTPGDFIMSRDAVNKYGLQMLTKMNDGVMSMAAMQNGGIVSPAAPAAEGSLSQVNNNSDFTFNIQAGGGEQEEGDRGQNEQQTAFAQRIRSAVTTIVAEESRRGGSLSYLF